MEPWKHQAQTLDIDLPQAILSGYKRICITCPTGGGKSLMMIRRILSSGLPSTVFTHRTMLAEQMSRNFDREGLSFGFRASGKRTSLSEPVQLAMVQTEVNAVIKHESREVHADKETHVDEAHNNATGRTLELLDRHIEVNNAIRIGWTATPLDIGHAYDKLIVAGNNSQLRKCGAHVPAYHYGPDEPSKELVGSVKIGEGECAISRTKKSIFAKRVFGSVIKNYWEINPEQKPTLLFAPGVPESIWFCEQMNDQGITAAHIDGENCWLDGRLVKTTQEVKDEIASRCESGNIKVVCNRFVLREGVDWPFIGHGIFATIFGSVTSYLQAGGRLIRAHESMDRVKIQDHGGNWWRHGSLNSDREWDLSYTNAIVSAMRMKELRENKEVQPINCVQCNGVRMGGLKCAHCGHEYKTIVRRRPVLQVDGSLKPMTISEFKKRRYLEPSEQLKRKWAGAVHGNKKNRPDRTLAAIAANFARNHNWQYPPNDFPMMPKVLADWFRPIGNVPVDRLTG